MGLRTTLPDFYPGAPCAVCKDVIFGGVTPMFVEAWVFSVDACPGAPAPPPDGIYLLEQQVDPCQWTHVEPFYTITWFLGPVSSAFSITLGPNWWFGKVIMDTCKDTFDNDRVCGTPFTIGESGWATIFWGPGIGP